VTTIALLKNISWIYEQPKGSPDSYRDIYQASAPLFLSQGLQLLMTQFPIWILGILHAGSHVAIFGVATRTTLIVSMPLLIANNIIMPLVAGLYKSGQKEKLRILLSASVTVTSITSTIAAIIFIFYGENLLSTLYGDNYMQGYIPLVILTFGALLNVYAGSASVLLAMSGNEKWVLRNIAISAFVAVATSLILVPSYTVTGAAISSCVGLILYNLLLSSKARSITGIATYLSPTAVKLLSHKFLKNRS
jgi:O-antigen/teichoic acid export membrane protein